MGVLTVSESFACDVDGVPMVYPAGRLVDSKDPVVKGRERFFVKAEDSIARAGAANAGETASAAPGERRLRRSARRAAKRAQEANVTGADAGEADHESGSNQVPGANNKNAPSSQPQTPEQKRAEAAAQEKAEEANPTGADDGEADPESGPSQVPGVNDDPSAKPGDGYDDGQSGTADTESGSNRVEGVTDEDAATDGADSGGPTRGITTKDVNPAKRAVPAKKTTAKKV